MGGGGYREEGGGTPSGLCHSSGRRQSPDGLVEWEEVGTDHLCVWRGEWTENMSAISRNDSKTSNFAGMIFAFRPLFWAKFYLF